MRWVKDFLAQSQGWEDFSRELESQWVGDVMRMSEHEIRNWRRNCEVIRRVKDLGWSMQEDILALIRLKVTRIATTETVQWAAIGLFEVVCEARDAVAIKGVCYIATYQSEKFYFNSINPNKAGHSESSFSSLHISRRTDLILI